MKKFFQLITIVLSFVCLTGCFANPKNLTYNAEKDTNYKTIKKLNGFQFEVPKEEYNSVKKTDNINTDNNQFFIMSDEDNYFFINHVNQLEIDDLSKDTAPSLLEKEMNERNEFEITFGNSTQFLSLNGVDKLIIKASLYFKAYDKTYEGYYSVVEDVDGNNIWMFVGYVEAKPHQEELNYIIKSVIATNDYDKAKETETGYIPETEENTTEILEATQWIGTEEFGYLQIPADFVPFQDIDGGNDLMYSDATGFCIFTMNKIEGVDVITGATNLASALEQDGMQDLETATVYVGYHQAKQLYGYYPDEGKFLVIWLIPDEISDTTLYYLACEFDAEHTGLVDYIQTWTLYNNII